VDELVEAGEVAVDGAHRDARALGDVLPARREDALRGVELLGGRHDAPPSPLGGGGAAGAVVATGHGRRISGRLNKFIDKSLQ
jgi:hypothetical protein